MKKPLVPRFSPRCQAGRSTFQRQKGQTLMLVAVSLTALIGLAALAIDVTTLYLAHSEAEKVADAAALAGAKAFVSTGFTSGGLGDWNNGGVQALACNGSTGYADLQALAAANQNTVGGAVPTVTTACNFGTAQNPQITVTVTRTALPTFFSRIFGRRTAQVTATSKAEAFNPSGTNTNISVANVKPWLVANCDYSRTAPRNLNCPGTAAYYLAPPTYAIPNAGGFIGTPVTLTQVLPGVVGLGSLVNNYYLLDIPNGTTPASCPSTGTPSCGGIDAAAPGLPESIACANTTRLTCGSSATQGVNIDLLGGFLPPSGDRPAQCLIHASGYGPGQGQDELIPSAAPTPTQINGGSNNPIASFRAATDISRSDSVVTVPIWDANSVCSIVAPALCTNFTIVGFMQIGITRIDNPTPPIIANGQIQGVILNVAGCGNATGTPIRGSGDSPIPVRLVR